MNYYERYCGDYAKKTSHLSLMQHGAYTVMLDVYYSTEKPLPGSYSELHRICRAMTKVEREAVNAVADEFFPIGQDGFRHNERADEMIPKALERIEKARENGKHGGRPKGAEKKPSGFSAETQRVSKTKPDGNPAAKLPNTNPNTFSTKDVENEVATQLSGKPDESLEIEPKVNGHTLDVRTKRASEMASDARRILEFLNAKAGRRFPASDSNLGIIVARFKEGFTPLQLRQVVAMKVRKWKGNEDMAEYLRPDTLFGRRKFSNYVGEIVDDPLGDEDA